MTEEEETELMQLFILDYDPEISARMLCDVHLRKMCLETAQILSSVLFLQGRAPEEGMPRYYNLKHPVIQAVDTPPKINYTVLYNGSLHREYFQRFQKSHAYSCLAGRYHALLYQEGVVLTPDSLDFARAFKGIGITERDLVSAYRQYYRFKKSRIRHWRYTNREEPLFLLEGE